MSPRQIAIQREGILARLTKLLSDKVPFDDFRVGLLLDAAWRLGQHGYAEWEELWTGILVAYGER